MTFDISLFSGLLLTALAVPAIVSGIAEGRRARLGWLMLLVAAGLLAWAFFNRPEKYQISDIPTTLIDVVARIVR